MGDNIEQAVRRVIEDEIMSNLQLTDIRDENFHHIVVLQYKGITIGTVKVSG
jgi:hypothetical protein